MKIKLKFKDDKKKLNLGRYIRIILFISIISIIIIVFFSLGIKISYALVLLIFLSYVILPLKTSLPYAISLIFVISAALLTIIHKDQLTHPVVIYAFFFFTIGVIGEISKTIQKEFIDMLKTEAGQKVTKIIKAQFTQSS